LFSVHVHSFLDKIQPETGAVIVVTTNDGELSSINKDGWTAGEHSLVSEKRRFSTSASNLLRRKVRTAQNRSHQEACGSQIASTCRLVGRISNLLLDLHLLVGGEDLSESECFNCHVANNCDRDGTFVAPTRCQDNADAGVAFSKDSRKMRYFSLSLTAAAAVLTAGTLAPSIASATPLSAPKGLSIILDDINPVQSVAICFYANGWNGPGLYECGSRNRRGHGWHGRRDGNNDHGRANDRGRRGGYNDRNDSNDWRGRR
jgi:hypothetical protein